MKTQKTILASVIALMFTPVHAADAAKAENAEKESEIEVIEVTGTFSSNLRSALNDKKLSNVIQDGISADDIGALPALDLGEALQAVPGIQLNREGERRESSVNLRGLPSSFVMTTANGQAFSTPSRSTNQLTNANPFGAYDPAIFNGITVIKSPSADMVEGGISGNIDMKLGRALSMPEQSLKLQLGARHEELNDENDPEFVISGSKHLDDGKFAIAGTVAWSKQTFRRDTIKINNYKPLNSRNKFDTEAAGQSYDEWVAQQNAEVGMPLNARVNAPGQIRQETEVNDGDRLSASFGLEWQPTEKLNFGANILYTDRTMDDNQLQQHIAQPDDNRVKINPLSAPRATGEFTDDGKEVWSVSDIDVRNMRSEHHSRIWDLETSSQAFIFDGEYTGDDWTLSGAITLSEATSSLDEVIVAQKFVPGWDGRHGLNAHIDTGEGNIGNFVSTMQTDHPDWFNLTDANHEWSDPYMVLSNRADIRDTTGGSTYGVRLFTIGGKKETIDRESESLEFNAERFFDSAITSVKFGYRYSSEDTDSEQYKYGTVGLDMRGLTLNNVAPHFTKGNDFFGGTAPGHLGADGTGARWLAVDPEALIAQLATTVDISQIECSGNGECPVLTDRGTIERGGQQGSSLDYVTVIDTHAAFAMANFEFEAGDIPVTGNLGLRYVNSDVTASAPLYDKKDVSKSVIHKSYNDYDYLLPSLNVSAELDDDLVLRFAYSEGLVRPNLRAAKPTSTINIGGSYLPDDPTASQSVKVELPGTAIDPYEATSYDLSLEWYNREGSAITVAVFQKDVSNFISTGVSCDNETLARTGFSDIVGTISYDAAEDRCTTSGVEGSILPDSDVNLKESINIDNDITVKGYELSLQQNLDFLPAPWNGLGGVLNYSHTTQDSDADNDVLIAGISEDTYNAIAYFEQENWGVRLSYNYRSDYLLQSFGTFNGLGNKSVEAAGRLDFAAYYNITEDTKINFKAYNLTEELYEEYQGVEWQPRATHFDGRVFSLSINHIF